MGWFGQEVFNRISTAKTWELSRRAAALQRRSIGQRITSTNPDETGNAWSGGPIGSGDNLAQYLQQEMTYAARQVDYTAMSHSSQIGLALDVYADESTIPNDEGNVIWTESADGDLASMLSELQQKRLGLNRDSWKLARNLAFRGNVFGEPAIYEKLGVVGLGWLDAQTVRRVESNRGLLMGFVQYPPSRQSIVGRLSVEEFQRLREVEANNGNQAIPGVVTFADWELVHWRIMGDGLNDLNGTSMLEPARWAWKRLHLLEDGAMLHKLTRAAQRYAYKVNVGNTPANGIWAFLAAVASRFKRKRYTDSSGKIKLGSNLLSPEDDLFLPVTASGELVSVEVLSGTDYQDMTPVDYFSGLVFGALKIPKLRIGSGEEIRKDALIGQDVGFARLIMRLQNEIIAGVDQISTIHLLALGIDVDRVRWQTKMSISSQIFELARMELQSARADLMGRWQGFASPKWILMNIAKISEDKAETMYREMIAAKLEMGEVDSQIAGMQQQQFQEPAESWFQQYEPDRRTKTDEKKLEEMLKRGLLDIDHKLATRARRTEGFLGDLARRMDVTKRR